MPAEPVLDNQTDADEHDLAVAVRGLAAVAADVDDLNGVLAQIAHLTVASVPGAEGAGVTVMRLPENGPPKVLAWAATHPFVREVDHLQYDLLAEGPCLTAMQNRRSLVSGSIGSDERWRRLGGRVARMDVHSALAVPLISGTAVVGALNIYAHKRDTFNEYAVRMAEQYARSAAVTVANIQALQVAHEKAVQLETALKSRATVDQAIGILRSRSGATEREAFNRLRQISQAENVKLALVAERLVAEAVRRAQRATPPRNPH
ncbi:ANTAR domain-containing protein [uncultured Jatrophihabitans sp.]|uniref:ANTAR domain-containing protein n=1 Tax=uncultured Jatrophihabitans sp. TaxID=1610747 RepID=UPI0035CBEF45